MQPRVARGRLGMLAKTEKTIPLARASIFFRIFSQTYSPNASCYGVRHVESAVLSFATEGRRESQRELRWSRKKNPSFTIRSSLHMISDPGKYLGSRSAPTPIDDET